MAPQSVEQRARSGAEVDPQEGLFDQTIDDTNLETLLDQRATARQKKLDAAKAFKEKDDLVKARLSEFELAVGEVARVGKYRIEVKRTEGGHREFDVGAGSRLQIKLID